MWYGVLCGLAAGAMWGTIFVLPTWLAAFSPLELALGRYLAYGLSCCCCWRRACPRCCDG